MTKLTRLRIGQPDMSRSGDRRSSVKSSDRIYALVDHEHDAYAPANHSHTGADVAIDDSAFSGVLAGAGITNAQQLAEWIDLNITLLK